MCIIRADASHTEDSALIGGTTVKKTTHILAAALLFSTAYMFVGCGGQEKTDSQAKTEQGNKILDVVTTTGLIGDIVKNVGGKRVTVTSLMGPGVDPHLYRASEGDVKRMAEADIIFYNGLHLEGAMTEVLEKMRGKAFAVGEGIDRLKLIQPDKLKRAYDPHIWFDVRLWMSVVEVVRDKLIEFDRAGAVQFGQDAEAYMQQLADLHDYVFKHAGSVPENQRVLVTAHDAFSYFGRAYGFQVRGLQGISTATEADTADVQELAQFIVDRKIAAIFVETSVPERSIKAVQAAVRDRGFDVKIGGHLYSDAMDSSDKPAGNYIGMVMHDIETIVNSLHGGRATNPS
jgi:manganese/zinc/iron transport system substrate-binding protein